ncbi:MAG: hypothetical protein JWM10_1894 [Myxococcaceae bacterium]|nr:hypothetical protein [Myxococcaceae bacterium]
MRQPDPAALPAFVRAMYLAMTAHPRRDTPDAATLPLLDAALPADLHALVYAWTFHASPGGGALRSWDVFERWDFCFSIAPCEAREVDRVCRALAGSSARPAVEPGFYVELGADAGGTQFFATVRDGRTEVFGPERGEDFGDVGGFLGWLYERADGEREPALVAVSPALFADDGG